MKKVDTQNNLIRGEIIKTADHTLLLSKAKASVAQRLIGAAVLVFLGFMLFNTAKMTFAADNGTTTLNVTVGSGVLEMLNVGSSVQFAAGTAGVASNVFQNVNGTTVRDFRGSGMGNWDLNMYSAPMEGATDSNYVIPNTAISVMPANASFTNVESYDTAKLGKGTQQDLSVDRIFFNSDEGTTGAVRIDGIMFKVNMNASLTAQNYDGIVTLTAVAS